MKEILQKLIDEIQKQCVEKNVNPDDLYLHLQNDGFLDKDEVDIISGLKTTSQKYLMVFTCLKGKDEKVYIQLQNFFHKENCYDLLDFVYSNLETLKEDNLIWHPPIESKVTVIEGLLEQACKNLKEYYNEDLELLEKYWDKFNIRGRMAMDIFYNYNIKITQQKKLKAKVCNYDQLFDTNRKRIIVFAEAGYGKSTFVHQMAREWVIGEKSWTKKFRLLFLFRLGEVREHEILSLQSILRKCLSENDSKLIYDSFNEASVMENCLFIFDGLDELQYDFCQEVDDLIFGNGINHVHTVVTTRPGKHLDQLRRTSCGYICIELNGFTDEGIKQQVQKFSINPEDIDEKMKNILKVPLYNTIFCITHQDASINFLDACGAIDKFVKFICNRYRQCHNMFTEEKEIELISILGQAENNKNQYVHVYANFFQKPAFDYPDITNPILSEAIKIGLINEKSTIRNLIFAHEMIAEYCAAKFYFIRANLKEENLKLVYHEHYVDNGGVEYFACDGTYFSCFLIHFSSEYKLFLWKNFRSYVPILDEYESLPERIPYIYKNNYSALLFQNQSTADIKIIIDSKIDFMYRKDEKITYQFNYLNFNSGGVFDKIRKLKYGLKLRECSIEMSSREFFKNYNVRELTLKFCSLSCKNFDERLIKSRNHKLNIEKLEIIIYNNIDVNVNMLDYLTYVMTHSTKLNSFKLELYIEYSSTNDEIKNESESDSSESEVEMIPKIFESSDHEYETAPEFDQTMNAWVLNLQNNEKLLQSLEEIFLVFSNCHFDFTNIFLILNKIVNLTKLTVRYYFRITKITATEMDILSRAFEVGFRSLQVLDLDIRHIVDKNVLLSLMENISKLENLKVFKFKRTFITSDFIPCLCHLFTKLKLEECEFTLKELFNDEKLFVSINMCKTLKVLKLLIDNGEKINPIRDDEEEEEEVGISDKLDVGETENDEHYSDSSNGPERGDIIGKGDKDDTWIDDSENHNQESEYDKNEIYNSDFDEIVHLRLTDEVKANLNLFEHCMMSINFDMSNIENDFYLSLTFKRAVQDEDVI